MCIWCSLCRQQGAQTSLERGHRWGLAVPVSLEAGAFAGESYRGLELFVIVLNVSKVACRLGGRGRKRERDGDRESEQRSTFVI